MVDDILRADPDLDRAIITELWVGRQGMDQCRLIPHSLLIQSTTSRLSLPALSVQIVCRVDGLEGVLLNAKVDTNDVMVATAVHLGYIPEQGQVNVVAAIDGEQMATIYCCRDRRELGCQGGLTPT